MDEVGRGPLAGPVVAAAVIVHEHSFTTKIFDSKQLSFSMRQKAYQQILKKAYVGVGIANREVIDQRNITRAGIIAMQMALNNLRLKPEYVLVDGRFKEKDFSHRFLSITKGDSLCFSIACASIVAKVLRDNLMSYYSALYSEYSFQRNRGYGTKEHLRAIKIHGITPIHRRSFRPISTDASYKVYKFKKF